MPGVFILILPLYVQQLTPPWRSSAENIFFILLNQIISSDKFPRGRAGRPKDMSIVVDFSLFCNIAFAEKKTKERFDRLHRRQPHMNVLISQRYVPRLKF